MKMTRDYHSLKTGESYTVEFELDINRVCLLLASHAYRNRTGKASGMRGALKARVVKDEKPQ